MHPQTGEIKEVSPEEAKKMEAVLNAYQDGIEEGVQKGEEVIANAPMIPIPLEQLAAVKKMSKQRRKVWARNEILRKTKRKVQRKARKAGRRGKSR